MLATLIKLVVAIVVTNVVMALPVAGQGAATRGAERYVRQTAVQVLGIVRHRRISREEKARRLLPVLINQIDLDYLRPWLLGKRYASLSPRDRAAYDRALPRYLARTFARRLARDRGEVFVIRHAEARGGVVVIVTSHLIDRNDPPPLVIKWRVYHGNRGFKVRDIAVQNISMALNLRREFRSIMSAPDGGISALLKRLRGQDPPRRSARRSR